MANNRRKKVLFVFGTRPEALKLLPVIRVAQRRRGLHAQVCITGQHREMLAQALRLVRLKPDFDLDLMTPGQTLGALTSRIFSAIKKIIVASRPDLMVVQGDTTSAFATALKSFYEKIPLAHVEAGLRTHDRYQPFPEEINRALISRLADIHFAPTREARLNLLREGIPKSRIAVTGNTIVDTLNLVRPRLNRFWPAVLPLSVTQNRIILVTAHRRENFGAPLESICSALKKIAATYPDVAIIFPVHPNPNVRTTVHRCLKKCGGILLLQPFSYFEFLSVMDRAHFIITDSGGIQEEAPSFGKPVLVMRNVSERPEGARMGIARIIGTSAAKIFGEASKLLTDQSHYKKMVGGKNPYGDGKAAFRIVDGIEKFLHEDRS